jgi:hypothetical protein
MKLELCAQIGYNNARTSRTAGCALVPTSVFLLVRDSTIQEARWELKGTCEPKGAWGPVRQ